VTLVRGRSSANLIHLPSQVKIDLFVAGGTPLDYEQLRRRKAVDVGLGIIGVQGAALDRAYLASHAPVLGVADLLVRALAQE
jgi:hypothetical protein